MKELNYIVALITTNSIGEAQHISRLLLEQKKAACVNVIPGVSSRFWWEENIESAQENLLIVKSKISLLPEIINIVKSIHSNVVPEVIALPVIGGNQDYLNWIDESLS